MKISFFSQELQARVFLSKIRKARDPKSKGGFDLSIHEVDAMDADAQDLAHVKAFNLKGLTDMEVSQ